MPDIRFPLMCGKCSAITDCVSDLAQLRRTLNSQGYQLIRLCPEHGMGCYGAACAIRDPDHIDPPTQGQ